MVSKLIQLGSYVNVTCEDGNTPLHEAYKNIKVGDDISRDSGEYYKAKAIIQKLEEK